MSAEDAERSRRVTGGLTGSYPALSQFGRYELLGRIAAGGMAEVFLAREIGAHGTRRHVAIKRILPHIADDMRFVEMFRDEARLAMQLSHPNICHIYEFGELDGHHYLAMEWIHGVSLGRLVRKAREVQGIPIRIAVKVAARIAEALHWAHNATDGDGEPLGLVHRDVTPHNIMIGFDGAVKLLDFGIAKANTQASHTRVGTVKGKFSYMSPEQCAGLHLDGRSDLFSLAVCTFEALTGKALYVRDNELLTMSAIVHEPTPSIRQLRPDVPEELDAILRKALEKDPARRFSDAGEMLVALERFLALQGEVVSSTTIAKFLESTLTPEERHPLAYSTPFGAALPGSRPSASGSRPRQSMPPSIDGTPIEIDLDEGPPARPSLRWPLVAAALGGVAVVVGGWLAYGGGEQTAPAAVAADEPAAPRAPAADEEEDVEADPVAENESTGAAPPAPAAPQAPRPGIVIVRSSPDGANVVIDEIVVSEETPTVVDGVLPGSHRIRLTRRGYEPWEQEIVVQPGRPITVRADLRRSAPAATPTGTLSLTTQPVARAYLGGRLLGTTPLTDVTVPSGALQIRLVDGTGESHMRAVRVRPGQRARVFFALGDP